MRRHLLASAVVAVFSGVAFVGAAQAVLPVEDAPGEASLVQQVLTAGKQLSQLQQAYNEAVATYNQVTNQFRMLTQFANPNGVAQELDQPFLRNPLPNVASLPGMVTGGAGAVGAAGAYANQFLNANRVYTPPPGDPNAALQNTQANALASIEGTAMSNLQSLQARIAGLTDLQSQLNNATTIQQVASINARIAAEQNYATAQQAQATNLSTIATVQIAAQAQAQQQSVQQQAAEAAQEFPVAVP